MDETHHRQPGASWLSQIQSRAVNVRSHTDEDAE